jgi:hypothetical protein
MKRKMVENNTALGGCPSNNNDEKIEKNTGRGDPNPTTNLQVVHASNEKYRIIHLTFGIRPFVATVLVATLREDSSPAQLWFSNVRKVYPGSMLLGL